MSKKIILGNIITMDKSNPRANAAYVEDGIFKYIGNADEAKAQAGRDVEVIDYGQNYIYPGFLESHSHGLLGGYRSVGQADLSQVYPTNYDTYSDIIKDFMAKNPEKEIYMAAGWVETEEYKTKEYLDDICSDKPLIMNTGGGHSCLLNTKALEWAGIDAAYAKEQGYDLVHVDDDGNPDGYICEGPCISLIGKIPIAFDEAKNYLLDWQDTILKNGFVAVADAGAELFYPDTSKAYHELEEEGKLKLRTYSYLLVPDNPESPKAEVKRIVEDKAKYSGEYYHVVGVKAFLDGVTEAHTGWQTFDYADEPGYHGVERFNDHDKMVDLIVAAEAEGLPVHVHSEGSGATKFMLDCIEDAQKITGNFDQRNVLAHLHFVTDEDIKRMASTKSFAAVAPLWVAKIEGEYDAEVGFVGKEMADSSYPIKSFYDAEADVVFHSDFPVSPTMDICRSIYMAEKRAIPEDPVNSVRNIKESISREQSLRAMTIDVARAWRQEDRMGTIEEGKLANMSIFDCDFLNDEAEKVANAKVVATIIDGEEVYKA